MKKALQKINESNNIAALAVSMLKTLHLVKAPVRAKESHRARRIKQLEKQIRQIKAHERRLAANAQNHQAFNSNPKGLYED